MLQSRIHLITTKPLDVQVWRCDPVVIVMNGTDIAYAQRTMVEFTPIDSESAIGQCIALTPDSDGVRPDFPELLEWPYLWQQTEYCVGYATSDYVFLVAAADHVLNSRNP